MSAEAIEHHLPESSENGKTMEHRQSDDSFKSSLDRALRTSKSRLTKEEEQQFLNVTLGHVKAQILKIQEQQGREKKLMNLTRMDAFLNVMGEWEQIVADFADPVYFSAFIWGSVQALLEVCIFHLRVLNHSR